MRHTDNRNEVQLTIRDGDGRSTSLYLTLPSRVALPVKGGDRIRAEVHAKWDAAFDKVRHAVALQTEAGAPLLLLQDAGILAEADLPEELRTADTETDAVYTDAGRLAHYCYSVVEHRLVVLGPKRTVLAPGDRATIQIGDAPWLVVALANAATTRTECPAYSIDRLSWLAVSVPKAHD